MSYNYRVINDNPTHFYPLNPGPTGFYDHTGRSNGSVNGTPILSAPLVVGGGYAYLFSGNNNFRFATQVFQLDSVERPFSLEAWFKPVGITETKGIIGHAGMTDGLTFDGDKISFKTSHGPAGNSEAAYYPSSVSGAFHVVGVHTGSKNELYVNGVRVASVDLTEEQLLYGYEIALAKGYLYVGHLPGSAIIDSVAVYSKAVTGRQVRLHFLWGRDAPSFRSVVPDLGGTYWDFTDDEADVLYNFSFDTEEEWRSGRTFSSQYVNNTLVPSYVNGVTVESDWLAGVILDAIGERLDGSKITWDGDGKFNIYTSIDDGATWSQAVNGHEVPGIGSAFTPGDRSLMIRVLFPAGQTLRSPVRLNSLSIKLYGDRKSSGSVSDQDPIFSGNFSLASARHEPIEHNDGFGVNLYRGSVTIPSNNVRTIEMYVRPKANPSVDSYIFNGPYYLRFAGTEWATSAGVQLYINGIARSGAAIQIPGNTWTHLVAVLPAATNDPIVIGSDAYPLRVGFYATYERERTAEGVLTSLRRYLGVALATVSEQSGLSVKDADVDRVKIYSHSWTLSASG